MFVAPMVTIELAEYNALLKIKEVATTDDRKYFYCEFNPKDFNFLQDRSSMVSKISIDLLIERFQYSCMQSCGKQFQPFEFTFGRLIDNAELCFFKAPLY